MVDQNRWADISSDALFIRGKWCHIWRSDHSDFACVWTANSLDVSTYPILRCLTVFDIFVRQAYDGQEHLVCGLIILNLWNRFQEVRLVSRILILMHPVNIALNCHQTLSVVKFIAVFELDTLVALLLPLIHWWLYCCLWYTGGFIAVFDTLVALLLPLIHWWLYCCLWYTGGIWWDLLNAAARCPFLYTFQAFW